MKQKVWLTRSWDYELWIRKPTEKDWGVSFFKNGYSNANKAGAMMLCPRKSKKVFNLKKQMRPHTKEILEGTMEFKFKQ